jgi:hypothetical protein
MAAARPKQHRSLHPPFHIIPLNPDSAEYTVADGVPAAEAGYGPHFSLPDSAIPCRHHVTERVKQLITNSALSTAPTMKAP